MVLLTVDQAIEKSGCGLSQFIYVSASSWVFFIELLSLVSDGILLPIIKCEWKLTSLQAAAYLFTTRLALGLGGAIGGFFGDKVGRRLSILIGLLFQITMTTIALNCYSISLYILFHTLNKIAFGLILPLAQTLSLESCPSAKRFLVKVTFGYTGCAGLIFGAFIGRFYEHYGWRNIQLMVTLPCYIAYLIFLYLDPSPRHLLVKGRQKEAEEVVTKILKRNGCDVDEVVLAKEVETKEKAGSYKDLFKHGLARHSYKLMYIIIMKGIFASTFYISLPYLLGTKTKSETINNTNAPDNCYSVNSRAQDNLVTAFIPDLIINPGLLVLAQWFGRRKAISAAMALSCLSFFLATLLNFSSSMFSLMIGTALATQGAGRGVIMLYVSELYPTTLRGVANGMIWVTHDAGSLIAPFFAEYVILFAPRVFISAAALAMGISAIVAMRLDTETLNKSLPASIADMSDNKKEIVNI